MADVGPMEVLVVLIIALVIFGPKRIPELGRSLGEGIKGFRESLSGEGEQEKPAAAPLAAASPERPTADTGADEATRETNR